MTMGMASVAHPDLAPRFQAVVRHQALHQTESRYSMDDESSIEPSVEDQQSEIAAAMISEFIIPSFEIAPDISSFVDFWAAHYREFLGLRNSLVFLESRRPKVLPLVDARSRLFDSVFRFGGQAAESAYRGSRVDLHAASLLVRQFRQTKVSPEKETEDRQLARMHNLSRSIASCAAVSLAFASHSPRPLGEQMKNLLIQAVRFSGQSAYENAKDGASLRGISTELPIAALQSGWTSPCGAMFKYLARTDPTILAARVADADLGLGLRARAVEAMSEVADHEYARGVLLPLLHGSAFAVREAAIHALRAHSDQNVVQQIRELALDEGVPEGLRDAAAEWLEAS